MKIRNVLAVSVAIVGLAASSTVYAAPVSFGVPVHAMFSKSKLVKFNVRNDSSASVELKVGEQVMTLDAGKTLALSLPIGTRILANATSGKYEAGTVLAEVSTAMSDATISLK
ncbi:hypothetical protein [Granulicella arctica]|uniref:Uncharacterized protein n=1 Tax=Granulicella arctica TaxID=940613 RepID=A0A7Y9PFR9_9BACT|nr:hypothetical protein [Granulicella arctica]NYF79103.1 hypothetical protein [Granulicella arctica]